MPIQTLAPTEAQIAELRNLFVQKYENDPPAAPFHAKDIDRVKNDDLWCTRFLEMYDLDMKVCLEKMWITCDWRQQFGTNELHESNVRQEYLTDGVIFTHNQDVDGKPLLIFKTKLHTKGTKNINEVIRIVVYWIERIHRETNLEKITIFFDMAGTGLGNMDLEFIKSIIDTFKLYYPNALNYILIYEMSWVLNAAFKIIKGLLPAKALEILKMVSKKDITTYIDKDNCLTCWGGNDPYEFKFVAEQVSKPLNGTVPGVATTSEDQQAGNSKKVHFDESPGETFSFEQEDGLRSRKKISEEMLRLSPNEFLTFSKGEASDSNVEITCTSQIPVIYKIQTTSPEKFRVRPRCGILNPGDKVAVSILLKPDHHLSESLKDKFLVMCLPAPPGVDVSSPQNMSEAWKHKQSNSSEVEQHRLCCVYKGAGDNVLNGYSGGDETAGKGSGGGASSNLSIQAKKLEKQLKLMQILQYVTLVFLLILSVAVIYLLKLQTASSPVLEEEEVMAEADVLGLASCPGTGKSL